MKVSSPSIPPTLFNFYCSIMEILGHPCHWASGIILWRGGNEGSSLWIPLICMEHKYSLFDSKTMYIYLNWDQVGMRDTDGFPSLWSKAMGSLLTDKYKRLFGGQIFLHHPQTLEHQQFSLISPPSSPDKGYPSFISQANSSMFSHDLIILPLFAVLSLTIFLLNIIFTLFTGPLPGQICFQSQSSLLDIENNSSLHLLFFQYFFSRSLSPLTLPVLFVYIYCLYCDNRHCPFNPRILTLTPRQVS